MGGESGSALLTVILAGGVGSRLQEETMLKPKPMVEIGGRPMLWHIMRIYAAYGVQEFAVALGYKGEVIKDFFLSYRHHSNSLTVDLGTGQVAICDESPTDWKVHLLDTGVGTQTGGRVKQARAVVGQRPFMLTYGDGVADVDIGRLLAFHRSHGRLATVTAVRPPARFGNLTLDGDRVVRFQEKSQAGEGWINGGFFVFQPEVFDYIDGDQTALEHEPLERLAREGQLVAYRHPGFWQSMDTLRDVRRLEELWNSGDPPWKVW